MRMPATPPSMSELLGKTGLRLDRVWRSDAGRLPPDSYPHWSKLRFRTPPDGLSHEEWWLATKLARASARHELPLVDKLGASFAFSDSAYLYRMLHQVDRDAGGRIEMPPDLVGPDSRDRYLVSSLIEESITSSQLEGAATSRRVAAEMLRSGRRPRDRSEEMIRNNYAGMEFLRENRDEDLSPPLLLELHRILTAGTLDDTDAVGRLRLPTEQVAAVDQRDGVVVHEPPNATALEERLERLFAFANARGPEPRAVHPSQADQTFLHPVVRAMLIHFMIGYEHPFVDGNGRTARALFYWSMARSGYWMTEFLSISTIIRKAPAQYMRAYLFSETDDNDVTYFLDYHLRVILRSVRELHGYLARKARQMREAERLLGGREANALLNYRQRALLAHMQRHPDTGYTIAGHRRSHNVTYETARTDLLKLADLGLLDHARQRRAFVFHRPADFDERLGDLVGSAPRIHGGGADRDHSGKPVSP